MNPFWRTSTVVALCEGMRQTNDYGACPILADALQDANYPDAEELAQLRDPAASKVVLQFIVARAYSNESFEATEWLRQFVRDINYDDNERASDTDPHSYGYVIACGMKFNQYDAPGVMRFGSDAGADYFRDSDENAREFFRNWSLATGSPPPADLGAVSYRCAC